MIPLYLVVSLFVSGIQAQDSKLDSLINQNEIGMIEQSSFRLIKSWQSVSYKSKKLNCQFYPSCSNYCALAIAQYGIWGGSIRGIDRFVRCNPAAVGYHLRNTNAEFQQDWNTLKSKLSNPNQKIMVILDSHYINWAHGDFGNIESTQMNIVADNYYELAKSDEKVIGILGYFWPNGFDIPKSIGARGMPQNVKIEYERIGREITRK